MNDSDTLVIAKRSDIVDIADEIRRITITTDKLSLNDIYYALANNTSGSPLETCQVAVANQTGAQITIHYLNSSGQYSSFLSSSVANIDVVKNSICIIRFPYTLGRESVNITNSTGVTILDNGILTHNSVRYMIIIVNDNASFTLVLGADADEPV